MEEGRIEIYLNEMPRNKKNKGKQQAKVVVAKMGIQGTTSNNPNTQGAVTIVPTNVVGSLIGQRSKNKARQKSKALGLYQRAVAEMKAEMSMPNIYLESLINPRDTEGIRLPDPFCRQHTATYQSKIVFNVTGVSGTALGNDQGRFCYVFNPIIGNRPGFNANDVLSQVSFKDGAYAAAGWTSVFSAASTNTYQADSDISNWVTGIKPLMDECRPVSMSVLASYNGNLVSGAGNIAIALVRGGTWITNLSNASAGVKGFANWENLANYPGAYDGPLIRGGYAYWLPDDETDYLLRDVYDTKNDSMDEHDYPLIVVSGQNGQIPAIAGGALGTCLRVECYINYEYTTNSRSQATSPGPSSTWMREAAMRAMCYEPTSMPNDWHQKFIASVLGGIGGFFLGGPKGMVIGALAPWASQIKDTALKA